MTPPLWLVVTAEALVTLGACYGLYILLRFADEQHGRVRSDPKPQDTYVSHETLARLRDS